MLGELSVKEHVWEIIRRELPLDFCGEIITTMHFWCIATVTATVSAFFALKSIIIKREDYATETVIFKHNLSAKLGNAIAKFDKSDFFFCGTCGKTKALFVGALNAPWTLI